ncbi:glycosyltransferase [Halomonas cerina]|uniref:Glycosyltransferase involved in cell wall biosynthesis n=1 Tax=Halomonas cerina TaxID=447424 RepID=A0A839V5Y2_9GAMM|nr:glycosyltransferase [Halomonas cerina]MBB3189408.1 glycosyltransferase involved in cell wall biosynthesis [Halomonas cerina]
MHIVHIITSLGHGGAQSALCRLCLNDRNNRHTIIAMIEGGRHEPELREHGIEILGLGIRRQRDVMAGSLRLWTLLRRYRPDVVQTWMYHPDLIGGIVARLAGLRHVCWGIRHSSLEPGHSARSTIMIAKACAWLSRWVPERVVCCAHQAAEVHHALGYDRRKSVVISNGYDLSSFYPRASCLPPSPSRAMPDDPSLTGVEARLGERLGRATGMPELDDGMPVLDAEVPVQDIPTPGNSVPVVGMVGRFNPQKDHEGLLRALAIVKRRGHDFRCRLIGPEIDEHNPRLLAWLRTGDLHDRVELLGARADIAELMNGLDLHILSSAFGEGFPNVIAEAMACGTPCVATDVGDTALIIGETGWVVPPRESERLAEAIIEALMERKAHPHRWAQRQHAAVERIRANFTIDRMVEGFDHVWKECLQGRD